MRSELVQVLEKKFSKAKDNTVSFVLSTLVFIFIIYINLLIKE